jgi:hypothetical protein
MDSFYITLINNKPDFSTLLKEKYLERQYEVAVVGFMYDDAIKENLGSIIFYTNKSEFLFKYEVIYYSTEKMEDFLNRINEDIEISLGKSENYTQFCYNLKQHRFEFKIKGLLLEFEGSICQILDIKDDLTYFSDIISEIKEPIVSLIQELFIYTDIIESQMIGESSLKILQIITREGKENQTRKEIIFNNPHYANVNKTYINSINIQILDRNNKLVDFYSNTSIIIKLHFRVKNGL